jgi:hypothetical protein
MSTLLAAAAAPNWTKPEKPWENQSRLLLLLLHHATLAQKLSDRQQQVDKTTRKWSQIIARHAILVGLRKNWTESGFEKGSEDPKDVLSDLS